MAANMRKCPECGRTFDMSMGWFSDGPAIYCSEGCRRKGKAAKQAAQTAGLAESSANIGRVLKLIRIGFIALVTLFTVLCYTFQKFLKQKTTSSFMPILF